ncbi:MAG: sulfite exporter TauE/SafE family protein [Phycisphaerales bacterium]|nr:sulfite exporter TauE/SafE family protein [Phycisphaerales bacterium]
MNAELIPMIGAVLLASLVGSLHCAGMCGAFVAMAVGVGHDKPVSKVRLQAAYHLGRLGVYSLIGAGFGLAGSAVDLGGKAVGLHKAAVLLAASTMIVVGLISLLRIAGVRVPRAASPGFMQKAFIKAHSLASKLTPVRRSLVIGLMTGLLPCGWLYAFALVAAGTAHPLAGAITMAAFWVGTLPVMIAVGTGVQALAGTLGRYIPGAMAVAIVTMGVLTALGRTHHMLPSADRVAHVLPASHTGEAGDVTGR